MKKFIFSMVALTIFAACQNYEDRYSSLEAQINVLASSAAALSQVQNDLTALTATVNSIQRSLSTTVDTALADGLAGLCSLSQP